MKKFYRILIVLVFIIVIFTGYVYIVSEIDDTPFYNEMADTLRDVLGKDFVAEMENTVYKISDSYETMIHNTDDVVVDADAQKQLDGKNIINHISNKNSKSVSYQVFLKPIKLNVNKTIEKPVIEFLPNNININLVNNDYSRKHLNIYSKDEQELTALYNISDFDNESIAPFPNIKPIILKPFLPGEGLWTNKDFPIDSNGEAIFYKTIIRPDVNRPWASVILCSIDLNKIDMHMAIGTGYRGIDGKYGDGKILKEHLETILCGFNAGFKPIHDNGGIVTNGKIFLPLKKDKGTIICYKNMKIEICDFNDEKEKEILEKWNDIYFIRQNQPPLITDGVINEKVTRWGTVVAGQDPIFNWRTAIGITKDNRLIFGVGSPVSAQTLAYALKLAGCENAMHTDMNISNCVYDFYISKNGSLSAFALDEKLYKGMVGRYLKGYSHDFFYLTKRVTPQISSKI